MLEKKMSYKQSYLDSQVGCFAKLAGFLTPSSCSTSAYMFSRPRSWRRMARASPDDELSERPSSSDDRSRLRVVVDVMSVVSIPNTGNEEKIVTRGFWYWEIGNAVCDPSFLLTMLGSD